MHDEDGFLSAIRQTPTDDTARLVFADWLDEQDDPIVCAGEASVHPCQARPFLTEGFGFRVVDFGFGRSDSRYSRPSRTISSNPGSSLNRPA
jgi:uncharacterized protein (TIGR02996 family)